MSHNDSGQHDTIAGSTVSWDGCSLALRIGEGEIIHFAESEDKQVLPELPEGIGSLKRVYWPLECLLVRSFSFPLTDTRLLDAAMLSQELAELTGGDDEAWWLAWHAGKVDEGIAGIVFGLPQSVRRTMESEPEWQQCPELLVDGWERLSEVCDGFETCAMIDEDAEGIFFAYRAAGVWRGIRRLNRKLTESSRLNDVEAAQQIRNSWAAMGAADTDVVVGRASQTLSDELRAVYDNWQVDVESELPERNDANLSLGHVAHHKMNFRHGRWAVQKGWPALKQWKRPLSIAATLLLLWFGATMVNIYSLESQADTYRNSIEAAFHDGLPQEKVMLDPLAQLKKASGTTAGQQEGQLFLRYLQAVSRVRQQVAWELSELNFRDGSIEMSGSARDINLLNRLRDQLQAELGSDVTITDTDLSEAHVAFRMKW